MAGLSQLPQQISSVLNAQAPRYYPALGNNQAQTQDYQMRLAPTMPKTQMAPAPQVPYEQYLRDNNVQDSPMFRLTYQKGLKPSQANLLGQM